MNSQTTSPTDQMKAVGEHWDKQTKDSRPPRARWWDSPTIMRHINRKVCGKPLEGPSAGFHELLREVRPGGYRRAVSVGCGAAYKEAILIRNGLVDEFFLYEVSERRVEEGRAFAKSQGFGDRMHYIVADAFAACTEQFDLVYWNNALHHMMDVPAAVSWSRARLNEGGVFGMDDYVGSSRFQWSDYSLQAAARFRASLSPETLGKFPASVPRPSAENLMRVDPSEAADSERTLPALELMFPGANIIRTGGAIYHPALNDLIANIDEGSETLELALLLDDILAEQGETHYCVAVAEV